MRPRHSRLDHPDIVAFLRRTAVSRLKTRNETSSSLQCIADKIDLQWGVRVHKSTLSRFLKRLGLSFAWRTDK